MASTSSLYELASSYWSSATLNAALELGIFPALAEHPASAVHLAESLSVDPETLRALLDAMGGLGLVECTDGIYCIAKDHEPFLNPASPDSLLGAFAFNRDLQGLWEGLAECVRSGQPVMPSSPHLGSDPERTRRFVEGMHSRAALMARGLLNVVEPEPSSRILDLAGGPGTFSLRLVERDPSLSINVFDLPPVVQAARNIHQDHPGLASVSFTGGDYHREELPNGFDLVFYCGALHQELPSEVPGLLSKISTALKPGGKLLIVDLLLDENRTTPVYSALFDLNMRLMKPTSHVHTVKEVVDALCQEGFEIHRTGDVPETPYRFVEASKG